MYVCAYFFFFLMIRRPPRSTRTDTLFPYTTLFRSSLTMEMCDVPAIAAVARRHGVLTMMDNTWASPLGFRPLDHGVDFSVEAATKRSEEHTSELQSLMRISYAVFCLKKKNKQQNTTNTMTTNKLEATITEIRH